MAAMRGIVIWAVVATLSAIASGFIAAWKNRNASSWAAWGFLVPPALARAAASAAQPGHQLSPSDPRRRGSRSGSLVEAFRATEAGSAAVAPGRGRKIERVALYAVLTEVLPLLALIAACAAASRATGTRNGEQET